MTTYRDMNNLPGPGDPETWGPCRNHPNDPRTPDSRFTDDEIYERRLEIAIASVNANLDWVREAFSEADDEVLKELFAAFVSGDTKRMGEIAEGLVESYVLPAEWEVEYQLESERLLDD